MRGMCTEVYYLVQISAKSGKGYGATAVNLELDDLEHQVVDPYKQGRVITVDGTSIQPRDIGKIKIFAKEDKYDEFDPLIGYVHKGHGKDVTNDFITGPPDSELTPQTTDGMRPLADTRTVFVVHGRNLVARDALFEFLRSIDLHPLEWSEAVSSTGKASPYIGEILDATFSRAHAIVVLFTPDDEAWLKESLKRPDDPPYEAKLSGQARPNVLFEAGMAMGRNPKRTVLVELGALRPFTDVAGIHVIRLDNTSQRRQELAQRLQTAGCPVRLTGTDWHTAGDFEGAVAEENDNLDSLVKTRFEEVPTI